MALFDFFKPKKEEKREYDGVEIKPHQNSSRIEIGVNNHSENETNELSTEESICLRIRNRIMTERDCKYDFTIEHKSEDYTTLVYRRSDLVRVKWTDLARWIKVGIFEPSKHENNPLFAAQKNKKEFMWKSSCTTEADIEYLYPFIFESFDERNNYDSRVALSDLEKPYVQEAALLLSEITNDGENIYISRTTSKINLFYKGSWRCSISLYPFKKKPWRFEAGKTGADFEYIKELGLYAGSEDDFPQYFELSCKEDIRNYRELIKCRYDDFVAFEKYSHIDLTDFEKYTFTE